MSIAALSFAASQKCMRTARRYATWLAQSSHTDVRRADFFYTPQETGNLADAATRATGRAAS